MNDQPKRENERTICRPARSTGFGFILGAGAGAALMAATDNPAFLGVGIGIGMLAGYFVDSRRRKIR